MVYRLALTSKSMNKLKAKNRLKTGMIAPEIAANMTPKTKAGILSEA